MDRETNLSRFFSLLSTSLAAGCVVAGCATRAPDNIHSSGPGGAVGFYQGFTNSAASPLPKPTGPFAVGRVDRLFTDSSRDILIGA
jgi:hypothetical protein